MQIPFLTSGLYLTKPPIIQRIHILILNKPYNVSSIHQLCCKCSYNEMNAIQEEIKG
uniref:Uncharacterized protein n=1 Tax=Anguilla anguilla TaxID=7936 RepID=A0A0E9XIC9_ANGAN